MIDSPPKNETMRALAFPAGLLAVTAAVYFGVTASPDPQNQAGLSDDELALEDVKPVSFDLLPHASAKPTMKSNTTSPIDSAVKASLSWTSAVLPDQIMQAEVPAALKVPQSPTAPSLMPSDKAGALAPAEVSLSPHDEQDAEHGAAHGDHGMMMAMPAADPNASACVAELQTIAGRTRVYFGTSASAVPLDAKPAIYQMAALAQRCPEAQIVIDGFTDPKGDPNENLLLSWKRANNVLAVMKQAGFDTSQFTTHSHMDEHPEYCIHYDVVDRRVEFVVTQNPAMAKSDRPLLAPADPLPQSIAAAEVPRVRPVPRPQ